MLRHYERAVQLFTAAAVLGAYPAYGAGYFLGDIGPRGMSRGGAFVAGVDNGQAFYYNPGALNRLEGTTFTANVASVQQYIAFDRADTSTATYAEVENLGTPMPIPSFVITQPVNDKTTVALGWYSPYGPDYEYDPAGPQRYTLKDARLLQGSGGPSVAYSPIPGLSIGGGITWTFQEIEQDLALGSGFLLNGKPTGDVSDIDVNVDTSNYNTWAWNAGVLFEPGSNWALGASVSAGRTYNTTGTLDASFADGNPLAEFVEEQTVTDEDVTVVIKMPLIARLGFAFRPSDALEIEIASVYEGWSVTQETLITDLDLKLTTSTEEIIVTEDVVLPLGFQDAVSVRLGATYDLHENLSVRGGGFWATSAIPTSTLNVSVVDGPKFGTGAGLTYTMSERFDLDIGFMKIFIQDQKINDSALEMALLGIDLTALDEAGIVNGENIGNGLMKSNATLAAIGLHMAFGRQSDPEAPTNVD